MPAGENSDRFILLINASVVSLLKWEGNAISEIRDGVFPISFKDDYEYSRPSRGTSFGYALKNFEKDKSIVKKERFIKFLRTVDKNLKALLNQDSSLLLAGTDKHRSDFKKISNLNHLISGEISGSHSMKRLSLLKRSLSQMLTHTSHRKLLPS